MSGMFVFVDSVVFIMLSEFIIIFFCDVLRDISGIFARNFQIFGGGGVKFFHNHNRIKQEQIRKRHSKSCLCEIKQTISKEDTAEECVGKHTGH